MTVLGILLTLSVVLSAEPPLQAPNRAPYANTWLLLGLFENDAEYTGFERDWIGEVDSAPEEGATVAGRRWRYFDDRLFSRNMDDYQDLFSYWRVKEGKEIEHKVAYAHVYAYCPKAQEGQIRVGGDRSLAAWLNGAPLLREREGGHVKDALRAPAYLQAGWNRILVKVATQQTGRFGFYARLSNPQGQKIPGLVYSPHGPTKTLHVATSAMAELGVQALPQAWRGWAYVGASFQEAKGFRAVSADMLRKPEIALDASDFYFCAGGGAPPYQWSLSQGDLPVGLHLEADGSLIGTVPGSTSLIRYPVRYPVTIMVRDATGASATKEFSLEVRERPNKWYEEARLGALIHRPESLKKSELPHFAQTMKRQGYALGFVIAYNNGDYAYRWPCVHEPDNELGDVVGDYKQALEEAGLAFGMYIGNLTGPNHQGDDGALLLVEDAILKYQPKAFWFDWAGWDGVSLDALYSMIKSYDPETIVVLNGIQTMSNGDWDLLCLEGWAAWGEKMWALWPFDLWWPKAHAIESWRLLADPAFEYSQEVHPDWQEYLRVQIALIGEGRIANIDHSPTIESGVGKDKKLSSLRDSVVFQAHEKMADWANPEGLPPLYTAYTQVNPGPLTALRWGYSLLSVDRRHLYLHALKTPMGKTGQWEGEELVLNNIAVPVDSVVLMNSGKLLDHEQEGETLRIPLVTVKPDPVDTILHLTLAQEWPDYCSIYLLSLDPIPPGNLAAGKYARLMSNSGSHRLIPSAMQFAWKGVDGVRETTAAGANEWAWTYQVDLWQSQPLDRIVIHFGKGYATEYRILVSQDAEDWQEIIHEKEAAGGSPEHRFAPVQARYVRIRAEKPDGPNQAGEQMQIAELEVYASEQGD